MGKVLTAKLSSDTHSHSMKKRKQSMLMQVHLITIGSYKPRNETEDAAVNFCEQLQQ
jgi:hypothetical protein